MNNIIEIINGKNGYLHIVTDNCPSNPREDDNLATIFTNSRRYNPDGHIITELGEALFYTANNAIEKNLNKNYIFAKVYAYEHEGISLRLNTPYNDHWDSYLFGVIAVRKERVREIYGWKKITKERVDFIQRQMEYEIKDYCSYINGECYGYIAYDNNDERIDSCYGYFGEDGKKDAIADGKDYID